MSIIGAGNDKGVAYSSGAQKKTLAEKYIGVSCPICVQQAHYFFMCCVALIAVRDTAAGAGMSRKMSVSCGAINSPFQCGDDSRTRFRSGESTIIITLNTVYQGGVL